MKRFTKVIAVISALVLACAFVGCKNDTSSDDTSSSDSIVTPDNDSTSDDGSTSNSDSSSSTQKQIVSEWENSLSKQTLVFYSDGTVGIISSVSSALDVFGTYTGDASKDGEITFKGQTMQGVDIAFPYSKATINGDELTATLSTGSSTTTFTKKK